DPGYTSEGVIKVPDSAGTQMGFVGVFLPTAAQNEDGDLVSSFAELRNPYLVMSGHTGDLGLHSGVPQSVYSLDADEVTEMTRSGPGYTSEGVIKVPDSAGTQMGFVGVFLPTAAQNEDGDLVSSFAELRNPYLVMSGYTGDLGLDSGVPQSVYSLDADEMTEMT